MEVTNSNFKDVLPLVKETLEKCLFVAIETELTGLESDIAKEIHPLDTLEERYQRLRESAQSFLVNQFGLSTFEWNEEEQQFVSKTFNFYIFPKPIGRVDQRFMSQSSSIHFLHQNGFDFNKMVDEGIPYLTLTQEKDCRQRLEGHQKPIPDIVRLNVYDQHFVNFTLKRIHDWQDTPSPKKPLYAGPCDGFIRHYIIKEIHSKFKNVCVELDRIRGKAFIVIREPAVAEKFDEDQKTSQLNELEETIGFRRIIELIRDSKKPVVGYNMLRDLANVLHQTYKPLPESCDQFKSYLHSVFGTLFDIRYIASQYSELEVHFTRSLMELYTVLNYGLNITPRIVHADSFDRYRDERKNGRFVHEAGFDAFMTGAAYIRMLIQLNNAKTVDEALLNELVANKEVNRLYLGNWESSFNICALQDIPNFDNVFHLSEIPENSHETLYNLFSAFDRVQLKWIDDSTAFVMVEPHQAEQFTNTFIGSGSGGTSATQSVDFKVETYSQYYANLNLETVIKKSSSPSTVILHARPKFLLPGNWRNYAWFASGVAVVLIIKGLSRLIIK